MDGTAHDSLRLHHPDRLGTLASLLGLIALPLLVALSVPGAGNHSRALLAAATWQEALEQAEAASRQGRMLETQQALSEAYRLAMREPGWGGLVALGTLIERVEWDRQASHYSGISFTARGAYIQALAWREAERHPDVRIRPAAFRMPEEEWP